MARRAALSEDDIDVIVAALEAKISTDDEAEIEAVATLFRARDRVLALKAGRSDKGTTRTPKAPKAPKATRAAKAQQWTEEATE